MVFRKGILQLLQVRWRLLLDYLVLFCVLIQIHLPKLLYNNGGVPLRAHNHVVGLVPLHEAAEEVLAELVREG